MLPAALPAVGTPAVAQAARWSEGMVRLSWRAEGASTMVATRPASTCHSMWQWKSQTREGDVSAMFHRAVQGGRDLSGLSARKRRTMFPPGRTMRVSRRIGTLGKVTFPT